MKEGTEKILAGYEAREFIAVNKAALRECVETLLACFRTGGCVLLCGNGGSCADSDHIVGELVKAFRIKRPLDEHTAAELLKQGERGRLLAEKLQGGLPAVNLCAQTSLLTAMINDVGGEYIFAQQIMAYGGPGDVLIGISTSGNSKDVLYAGTAARARGMKLIGLSGRTGGEMAREFDVVLHAQASSTEDIQDQHSTMYHAVCAAVEYEL